MILGPLIIGALSNDLLTCADPEWGRRGRTPTPFFANFFKIIQKNPGGKPPNPLRPLLFQILDPPLTKFVR